MSRFLAENVESYENIEIKKSNKLSKRVSVNQRNRQESPYSSKSKHFYKNSSCTSVKNTPKIKKIKDIKTNTNPKTYLSKNKWTKNNSEINKKLIELHCIKKATQSRDILNFNAKNCYKKSLPCIESFEEQINRLAFMNLSESIPKYFELLEEIAHEDTIFGSLIMKIINRLYEWKNELENVSKNTNLLGLQSSKKGSVINMLINEKNLKCTTLDMLPKITSSINESLLESQAPLEHYKFLPLEEWKILEEKGEKLEKDNKILQEQLKTYHEKEIKYSKLLTALNDRGYPVHQVYMKDVNFNEGYSKPSNFVSEMDEIHMITKSSSKKHEKVISSIELLSFSSSNSSEKN